VEWRVEVTVLPPEPRAAGGTELLERVHRRRLDAGWDLAVCLTDLPLHAGHRPVTTYASATHRVGLVSVPAFGAVNVEERVREAVLRLIEGLVAESLRAGETPDQAREERISGRLREIAAPLGASDVRDRATVRFATAVVRGNLRLLVGMVRANEPSRVIARMSRALATTPGTAAIATANISI
jgi:hypothetical protein